MIAYTGALKTTFSRQVLKNTLKRQGIASYQAFLTGQVPVTRSTRSDHFSGITHNNFSTLAAGEVSKSKGTITRTLQMLDMSTVKKIEVELKEVDKNFDGR